MTWTVQATDLRRRVRAVLDRVRVEREPVVIRSYDMPQAVIILYTDPDSLGSPIVDAGYRHRGRVSRLEGAGE